MINTKFILLGHLNGIAQFMACAENSEASWNNQYELDLFHDSQVTINVNEKKL